MSATYTMFTGRCPNCHEGKVMESWFGVRHSCEVCGVVYLRDPGSWTGATVVAYMLGSVWVCVLAMVLWATGLIMERGVEWPLMGSTMVVLLLAFRYVKRWWVGLLFSSGYVYADADEPAA